MHTYWVISRLWQINTIHSPVYTSIFSSNREYENDNKPCQCTGSSPRPSSIYIEKVKQWHHTFSSNGWWCSCWLSDRGEGTNSSQHNWLIIQTIPVKDLLFIVNYSDKSSLFYYVAKYSNRTVNNTVWKSMNNYTLIE